MTILLNTFCPVMGFITLTGLLLFWILKRRLPSIHFLKKLILFYALLLILFGLITSFLNAWLWSRNPLSSHLLPPDTPLSYILHYSWQHYLFEPTVVILFAFLIYEGIYFLNKKFADRFFYKEEKYLAALGILITGWPNCLIFLCLVLFLGIMHHLLVISFRYFFSIKARRDVLRNAQADKRAGLLPKVEERGGLASSKILAGDFGMFSKNFSSRLSLLYFWLPLALLVLLLGGIISKYLGINQFKI